MLWPRTAGSLCQTCPKKFLTLQPPCWRMCSTIWEAAPTTHLWPGFISWIANKVGGQWKKCRNSVWSGTKAGMRQWWEVASCSSGATRNCKHLSWNESKVLMSWKSWTNLGGWGTSGQAWVLHSVHLKRRSTFSRLRPSMKSSASTCSLASLFSTSLKLNTEFVYYNGLIFLILLPLRGTNLETIIPQTLSLA